MRTNDTDHRLFAEYLQWIAHKELALGAVRAELWASAVVQCAGDEDKARAYTSSRGRSRCAKRHRLRRNSCACSARARTAPCRCTTPWFFTSRGRPPGAPNLRDKAPAAQS
jgi:hypothetical protein